MKVFLKFVLKSMTEKKGKFLLLLLAVFLSTALFVGSIFLVIGLMLLNPLLRFLGSTETILPYARQYGGCVLLSCPIVMASFVLNNNLRYDGKSFYSMIGLVSGGLINIFLDYLLLKHPQSHFLLFHYDLIFLQLDNDKILC